MLTVGDIVPATDIATDTGIYSLAPHDGKKMVIFFFPRADTSGCIKESLQFSDLIEDFAAVDAEVIGISKDTPQKLAKFRAKFDTKFRAELCMKFHAKCRTKFQVCVRQVFRIFVMLISR